MRYQSAYQSAVDFEELAIELYVHSISTERFLEFFFKEVGQQLNIYLLDDCFNFFLASSEEIRLVFFLHETYENPFIFLPWGWCVWSVPRLRLSAQREAPRQVFHLDNTKKPAATRQF